MLRTFGRSVFQGVRQSGLAGGFGRSLGPMRSSVPAACKQTQIRKLTAGFLTFKWEKERECVCVCVCLEGHLWVCLGGFELYVLWV